MFNFLLTATNANIIDLKTKTENCLPYSVKYIIYKIQLNLFKLFNMSINISNIIKNTVYFALTQLKVR